MASESRPTWTQFTTWQSRHQPVKKVQWTQACSFLISDSWLVLCSQSTDKIESEIWAHFPKRLHSPEGQKVRKMQVSASVTTYLQRASCVLVWFYYLRKNIHTLKQAVRGSSGEDPHLPPVSQDTLLAQDSSRGSLWRHGEAAGFDIAEEVQNQGEVSRSPHTYTVLATQIWICDLILLSPPRGITYCLAVSLFKCLLFCCTALLAQKLSL